MLVIIGLIIGGVLVGQSLIAAATIRAQVTQIEKFNQAANTFFEKYGYLPGDIKPAAVTQFGFTGSPTRTGVAGDGDGNGELDGSNCCTAYTWDQGGELLYFWVDLSTNAHLIEGAFNSATGSIPKADCTSNATCSVYFPPAKIGNGAYIYVYSGYASNCCTATTGLGPNFFGISVINSIVGGSINQGAIPETPPFTVAQAYAMDGKIDDGLPTSGNVIAQWLSPNGGSPIQLLPHGASASATTCYDTSSGTAQYSVTYKSGALVNCSLSFKMQAGD